MPLRRSRGKYSSDLSSLRRILGAFRFTTLNTIRKILLRLPLPSPNLGAGSRMATLERMSDDEIAAANDLLANAGPEEILRWAVRRFHPKLLMATAFGAEGCCILHWLAAIEPRTTVINLETGYQFPETLALRERIKEKYGIEVAATVLGHSDPRVTEIYAERDFEMAARVMREVG